MPLLIHGVLAAEAVGELAPAVLGEDADDVELLVEGELAALIREIETPEALPSRANLLAHARVLERAGEATTVAPMRFGVVVADRETLAAELNEQRDHLLEVIERLTGHLEYRLRGRYDEDEVVAAVVATDSRAQRLRGQPSVEARMELGERVVAGIDARRDADRAHVVERLEPVVASMSETEIVDPLDAFALSLLVATVDHQAFDERLEELGAALQPLLTMELIGPMPPVSFTGAEAVA